MINLVTSCSARKRIAPATGCSIGEIRGESAGERLAEWTENLAKNLAVNPASELYAGDHWSVVSALGDRVQLWIASAGQGLLQPSTPVVSYSATFARGQRDSVGANSAEWWAGLAEWNQASGREPASIAALAESSPEAPLIVATGADYLKALRNDLLEARDRLADPELLSIVCAGTRRDPELGPNLIPCDARLQQLLGGSRSSLNARIARYILEQFPAESLRAPELTAACEKLLAQLPDLPRLERRRLHNDEIRAFISTQLDEFRRPTHTALLRKLRQSGSACEESRFRRLFRQLT